MRILGNILWFVLGGFFMGVAWWFFGILAFVSILGIPWARSCFVLGSFSFLPFGRVAVRRNRLTGREDIGTGCLGLAGNIVWCIVAGIWLAMGHVASALACAVTVIGIPFAWQHLKLAGIALFPVGMTVVPVEEADSRLS